MMLSAVLLFALIVPSVPIHGMTYVSWQAGEYPYTTAWKAQTYWNSRAIDSVGIDSFQGDGALWMHVHLDPGNDSFVSGEVFVNVLYFPPLTQPPARETLVPVDMRGQRIRAEVWCPPGSRGNTQAPNGIQLFVKDKAYASWYTSWQNIGTESTWNVIDTVIPMSASGIDLSKIILIGFKVGVNTNGGRGFNDTMWLDNVSWGSPEPEYPFEHTGTALDSLKTTGCNYVGLINTWYVDDTLEDSVYEVGTLSHSDTEMVHTMREIWARRESIMVKPHVDVKTGDWRGSITPPSIERWFRTYRRYIFQEARLASEQQGVGLFCVGTELAKLDTGYLPYWLGIIDTLRQILGSSVRLTYAGNWGDGAYKRVCFWDSLDIAGIDAYFPLCTPDTNPSLAALVADWQHWRDSVREWHDSILHKDVMFTEIGYISRRGANVRPYENGGTAIYAVDESLQARLYAAAIIAWEGLPWFEGRFWWHWSPVCDAGGPWYDGYTPQNKLAQDTLYKYWSGVVDVERQEQRRGMLRVAPNPSRGRFRLDAAPGCGRLALYDALGRDLRQYETSARSGAELDVLDLPSGIYFVEPVAAPSAAVKVVIRR